MNYDDLYKAWKREKESTQLQQLPKDFYDNLAGYMKSLIEKQQMLDEKSLMAKLLTEENAYTKRLFTELLQIRRNKITAEILDSGSVSIEACTREEEKLANDLASITDTYKKILNEVLEGKERQVKEIVAKPKKLLVRFLQSLPAIIGADTKTYGPFKQEDLTLLPTENAEALLKQGVVVKVETER